jgi:hypothetical protein
MNNPRLAAAMDVVTSDAEEQILDPRTLAMLKYKDALQAMQAADQMMASAQPAPTAPTVAERTKLAAEQGIAGLAQRLSPGVQQRGSQMAAQQAQQMMSGGLPQLSAPNMAGMAGGGIVAFAEGGMTDAEIEAILREPRSAAGEALMGTAEYAVENPVDAALIALAASGLGAPLAGGARVAGAALPRLYRAGKGLLSTGGGRATAGLSGLAASKLLDGEEELAVTPEDTQPSPAAAQVTARPRDPNFRVAGIDQQPDLNVGIAAPAAAPTAPTNTAQDQLRARVEGTGGSTDAGSRYRELTGMEDAIRERRVEQDRLRALQEARFSPEQERSRLLRAGLAGLASRGFGGFSSGIAGEEEAIAGERDTAQQRVVADMDKTISELRALGIGQFEAEQAAAEIHSNELRALAALDQDAAKLKQDMDIENLRADLIREGYDAEASQALAAAVNDAAVRNSMTTQQVLTIAQRIVADDLTNTKTLPIAVQEVRNAAGGAASPVDAETQSYLDQYATQ